jgi:colicin import membrane protein
MQHDNTETSVLISLRELAALESDRQREEERERILVEQRAEAARLEASERARAAEEARRAAEEAERAERRRRETEEAARLRAIEQAEIERARLEAEATAQRALRDAENRHTEELARLHEQRGSRRLRRLLYAGLTISILGGGAAAFGVERHFTAQASAHDARIADLAGERQRLLDDGLASLDRLHAQLSGRLQGRPLEGDLAAARDRAQATRNGLAAGQVDEAGLDAFEAALDGLRMEIARQDARDRLARLDVLHREAISAFGEVQRPGAELAKAEARARSARRLVDDRAPSDLAAFERALGELTAELAVAPKTPGVARPIGPRPPSTTTESTPCDPKDPMAFCLP